MLIIYFILIQYKSFSLYKTDHAKHGWWEQNKYYTFLDCFHHT